MFFAKESLLRLRLRTVLCSAVFLSSTLTMVVACHRTQPVELTVSVAASLTGSIEPVEALYKQSHPGVSFRNNFGSSGALAQQIQQGAPADLLLSAGVKPVEQLAAKGLLIDGQTRNLLRNTLVLIVPAETASSALTSPAQLASSPFSRIASGEPSSVPAGLYTQQTLQALHLDQAVKAKLVYAKDVRQVLAYVESGDVQAGFVYLTDAMTSRKVRIACKIDDAAHAPIVYPLAVVARSQHLPEAEDFARFLLTPAAQAVFAEKGFSQAAH